MDGNIAVNADFTIPQNWNGYTPAEHARWNMLYERQAKLLPGRACDEFMSGLQALDLNEGGIPDFARLNEKLNALTGWTVVAVPHLVPDEIFFEHLANRRFPAGRFIRGADQIDYIQEPDVFHDVFGHVPMLALPVFADHMQDYGKSGIRALAYDSLKFVARLYWYTVEFGLVRSPKGLRVYGAGIVSSRTETLFALEDPSPNRIGFNLARVMNTDYRIDDFQETYFVLESFDALRRESFQDFREIFRAGAGTTPFTPAHVGKDDHVLHRGTGDYARGKLRAAS
ncbi:MAG: phenylalanine 4-monooxygenase [Rhodospirillaceae bacterium]